MYKLTTLIITDKVYSHIVWKNNILPFEHKWRRREACGNKDHQLLDKNILEQAKTKKRNVSILWIDYTKMYDSVPHLWIE